MPFTRRDMLKVGLTGAAGFLVPFPVKAAAKFVTAPKAKPKRTTFPIVQGATDDTKTQFSVVHASAFDIAATVTMPGGGELQPDHVECIRFPNQPTAVTQLFFSGLSPGQDMQLTIWDSDRRALDKRIFRTLDPHKGSFQFAICSCMDDTHHEPEIWRDLVAQSPDVIFFIGDSVYCDKELHTLGNEPTPATLWRRFSESRVILEIYHQERLIPIIAVWDDHDFGKNDTNSVEFPYAKESKKNFLTFFPQNPKYCRFLERGPGIASAFNFRGQQVLLMDDRSYRLPKGSPDRYAHWGMAQEKWALEKIRGHRDVTWLMNGSQLFPNVPWKESLSRDHDAQFKGFMAELAQTRRKVIFASGDVHYSEVSRIEPAILGYETFEVTSSSIHSTSMPGFPALVPNRRRIMSTGGRNYVLVNAEHSGGKMNYLVQSRAPGNRVQFQLNIGL